MYARIERDTDATTSTLDQAHHEQNYNFIILDEISDATSSFTLGGVQVFPGARTLLLDGLPVDLGSRAFDVLMTLLEARGRIVSKEVIMRRVWPTTTVEETNLRVQLSALRRALGEERWRIKTIPGRGYFLVAQDAAPVGAAPPVRPVPSSDAAVVIIDGDCEIGEFLRRMLVSAGARVESLASLAASFVSAEDIHKPIGIAAGRSGPASNLLLQPRAI